MLAIPQRIDVPNGPVLVYRTLYGAFRRSAVLSTSDVIPPDQAFYVIDTTGFWQT